MVRYGIGPAIDLLYPAAAATTAVAYASQTTAAAAAAAAEASIPAGLKTTVFGQPMHIE